MNRTFREGILIKIMDILKRCFIMSIPAKMFKEHSGKVFLNASYFLLLLFPSPPLAPDFLSHTPLTTRNSFKIK